MDGARSAPETPFAPRGAVPVRHFHGFLYVFWMAETATPEILPDLHREEKTGEKTDLEPGFLVVCWNDPVNLMVYVTHVFMKVFGWNRQKAEKHMLEVHEKGRSVLVREGAEKAEFYVHQLQGYKLQATMEPAE